MSEIKNVSIGSIDPNPFRLLATYPWIEGKLEQLERSIRDVGLWEGIIVRQVGKRYEMAFGHHRLEAAKRTKKLKKIDVIVRKLTDEEMLKFMGRENGEDYGTEFLIMLNTWEGAVNFAPDPARKTKPIDIARLLGWVRGEESKKGTRMSHVAVACAAAHALIGGGYMTHEELTGLSVEVAKDIVTAAQARMARIDSFAEKTQRPHAETEQAKRHIAKGAKRTADKVREGTVATRKVRGSVEVEAFRSARESKAKPTPLFAIMGNRLADQLDKMLHEDAAAAKLTGIIESIDLIEQFEDAQSLRRIRWSLENLGDRALHWRKQLKPKGQTNVVRIDKLLEEKG